MAAQPAGLPLPSESVGVRYKRKHAAIEKRTHTRARTHPFWVCTHTHTHTQTHRCTLTQPLTYKQAHTHAVSEKGKGFVTVTLQCEKWGVSLSEGRFVDTWEVRRRAEKISFKKVRVLVREFLSLSIIYQCLSLWQLLCQALPVLLSPGSTPAVGQTPAQD